MVWASKFYDWFPTIHFITDHNRFTNTIPRWGLNVSVPGIRSSTDVYGSQDHNSYCCGLDTIFHQIAASSPGWFCDTTHSTLFNTHSLTRIGIDGDVSSNIPLADLSLVPTTDTSIGSLSALQVYVAGREVGQDTPHEVGHAGSQQQASSSSPSMGGGGGGQDPQHAGSSGDKRKKQGDGGREEEEDEEVCFMSIPTLEARVYVEHDLLKEGEDAEVCCMSIPTLEARVYVELPQGSGFGPWRPDLVPLGRIWSLWGYLVPDFLDFPCIPDILVPYIPHIFAVVIHI
jgi:hypothetical protein